MSKITVTTIAGLTSGGDANTVKIESGDAFQVVSGTTTLGGNTDITGNTSITGDTATLTLTDSSSHSANTGPAISFFSKDSGGTSREVAKIVGESHSGANEGNLALQTRNGGTLETKWKVFKNGNLIPTNSAYGIILGNTVTGDANLLDDYEEGTWSPGINYAGNNTNATMNQTSGTYVKIGRQVFCSGMLYIGNKNGGTGDVFLTGLPFTAVDRIANTSIEGNGIISYYYGLSASVHTQSIAVIQSGTTAEIYTGASGTNSTRATVSHYDNSAQIRFSFTYHT